MTARTAPVVIVGAGLGGAVLAHLLRPHIPHLVVLEKARGPGGRMSTRRTALGQYNHGAAGFIHTAPAPFPTELLARLPADQDAAAFNSPANAYVRQLLGEAAVRYQTRVARLANNNAVWSIQNEHAEQIALSRSVLLTIPAPQAAELLQSVHPAYAHAMGAAVMSPRWVVLMKFRAPDLIPATSQPTDAPWQLRPAMSDVPLCRVAASSETWARARLEQTPDTVIQECLGSLGIKSQHLEEVQAHRWRYATCAKQLDGPGYWDPARRLGLAGDAFASVDTDQGILRTVHSAHWLARQVLRDEPSAIAPCETSKAAPDSLTQRLHP